MRRERWTLVLGLVLGFGLGTVLMPASAAPPKVPRYDFPLAVFPWDKAPSEGGVARYVDEGLGVACYALYAFQKAPKATVESLSCVKVR